MNIDEESRTQKHLRSAYKSLRNIERTDRAIAGKKDIILFNCVFLPCLFTAAALTARALGGARPLHAVLLVSAFSAACFLARSFSKIRKEERILSVRMKKALRAPMHIICGKAAAGEKRITETAGTYKSEIFRRERIN